MASETPDPRSSRRAELAAFIVLAVLIGPIIAVGFVVAYGTNKFARKLQPSKGSGDEYTCIDCHKGIAYPVAEHAGHRSGLAAARGTAR